MRLSIGEISFNQHCIRSINSFIKYHVEMLSWAIDFVDKGIEQARLTEVVLLRYTCRKIHRYWTLNDKNELWLSFRCLGIFETIIIVIFIWYVIWKSRFKVRYVLKKFSFRFKLARVGSNLNQQSVPVTYHTPVWLPIMDNVTVVLCNKITIMG